MARDLVTTKRDQIPKYRVPVQSFPGGGLRIRSGPARVDFGDQADFDIVGNAFTVEIWMTINEFDQSLTEEDVMGRFKQLAAADQTWIIRVSPTYHVLFLRESGGGATSYQTGQAPAVGVAQQIIYSFTGTQVYAWVDRVKVIDGTAAAITIPAAPNTFLFMGARDNSNDGLTDTVLHKSRFWTGTSFTSTEDIHKIWHGQDPDPTKLVFQCDFTDGSGTTVTEAVNGNNGTISDINAVDWVTTVPSGTHDLVSVKRDLIT